MGVSYVRTANAPDEKAAVGELGDAHDVVGEVAHDAQLAGALALVGWNDAHGKVPASETVGVDEVRELAAAVVEGRDPAKTRNAWDVEDDALTYVPENAVATRYVAYHYDVSLVWQSVEGSPGAAKPRREEIRDYAYFHYGVGK